MMVSNLSLKTKKERKVMKKILQFTKNENAAKSEIEATGGRIIQQFTPTAFVAELPENVNEHNLKNSTSRAPKEMDLATELAYTAWLETSADEDPAPTPQEGLAWDSEGYEAPFQREIINNELKNSPIGDEVALSTGTPTSLRMIGKVAIGLVIVSRDQGPEQMTTAEQTKIVQEVQRALTWLATVEPRAKVSFYYDIKPITVSTLPGPYSGTFDAYERMEKGWRDDALNAMGYPSGRAGYQQYTNHLIASKNTDWGFVAFFTKYRLNHFAYAIWEKVVMEYANDGWGPDNIHRVFAHESCHIFGAADEYGNCACGGSHGYLGIPNNNCINCFPPGQQLDCLMNANKLTMCEWSRKQIGWADSLFP
jgi:hypothetical protein